MRNESLFGVMFGLAGGVLFAVAIGFYIEQHNFASTAKRTQGKVIALEPNRGHGHRGHRNASSRRPVVRYVVDGIEYEIRGKVGSSPPAYRVGQAVQVMYPPTAPGEGRINGFLERYYFSALFGGIGAVFSTIGIGGLIVARKKRPKKPRPDESGSSYDRDAKLFWPHE